MNEIKVEWQNKTLAEWFKMFPENIPIKIQSYGVWKSTFGGGIQHFNRCLKEEQERYYSDNDTKNTSEFIVKRIFQDPSDHERLIFDVQGDTVYLWNKIMMENKDPDREMMVGLRVPLKDGADPLRIFTERKVQWRSQPFYIDEFAISRLMNKECLK